MAKGQIKQKQATINRDIFEKLCSIQCTQDEIAAVLEVSYATIERWCKNTYNEGFVNVYKKLQNSGKSALRRKQWHKAIDDKGDTTMLIWLGKQYLGQTDKLESETIEKIEIVNDLNKNESNID